MYALMCYHNYVAISYQYIETKREHRNSTNIIIKCVVSK